MGLELHLIRYCINTTMKELSHIEKIAVMRILYDIILADKRIDKREEILFSKIANELELDGNVKDEVQQANSLLALTFINEFSQSNKEDFAKVMGQMIIIDEDINYNEVKVYNVVCDFCKISQTFEMDDYPEYTRS